jgi:4'-phosphopantetheinyl transferase
MLVGVSLERIALESPPAGLAVWRADLDDPAWPDAGGLPVAERRRASSILDPRSRRRWAASRWALRRVLGRLLGEDPRGVAISISDRGRPRLLGSEEVRFSLSHSGGLALIAVSTRHEVGVDLERERPGRDFRRLSERFLEPAHAAATRRSSARPEDFYRAWTRHEAIRKLSGCEPSTRPSEDEVEVVDLAPGPGWAGALARERAAR